MWDNLIRGVVSTLVYTGVGTALFTIAYLLLATLLRGRNLNRHLEERNTAAGIALAGFFIGIALAVSGAIQ